MIILLYFWKFLYCSILLCCHGTYTIKKFAIHILRLLGKCDFIFTACVVFTPTAYVFNIFNIILRHALLITTHTHNNNNNNTIGIVQWSSIDLKPLRVYSHRDNRPETLTSSGDDKRNKQTADVIHEWYDGRGGVILSINTAAVMTTDTVHQWWDRRLLSSRVAETTEPIKKKKKKTVLLSAEMHHTCIYSR